jgi:hypothetical protein
VIDGVKHGYVYEVDPSRGGNPRPIMALGRFEHEAVSFDRRGGTAYLTEDADTPFATSTGSGPAGAASAQATCTAGEGCRHCGSATSTAPTCRPSRRLGRRSAGSTGCRSR